MTFLAARARVTAVKAARMIGSITHKYAQVVQLIEVRHGAAGHDHET
jgi:hypothetical protein